MSCTALLVVARFHSHNSLALLKVDDIVGVAKRPCLHNAEPLCVEELKARGVVARIIVYENPSYNAVFRLLPNKDGVG